MAHAHVDRREWCALADSLDLPHELRDLSFAMRKLAKLMSADGTLCRWQSELTDALHSSPRTIRRYLVRLEQAGLLDHEKHGGQGRRGVYRATSPIATRA